MREVTVGIDIGTTSVKAIAADADGEVVAQARIPHPIVIPSADRFEHDANRAWRLGPRRALAALGDPGRIAGVSVAAMVPSLTAVDRRGIPRTPGLLYGDERGRADGAGGAGHPGEMLNFLRWSANEFPAAAGFWPAQAVANHALSGEGVIDASTAFLGMPLWNGAEWDASLAAAAGADVSALPRVFPSGAPVGRVGGPEGPVLASGGIDAMGDQIVAGADEIGDVLVLLGTTLIVWAMAPPGTEPAGYYALPDAAGNRVRLGGPSNVGGLFINWALAPLRPSKETARPDRVPVWAPYPRGERVPMNDPDRRAVLADLDLTHDATAIRRATFEACGFAVRRVLDAGRIDAKRVVAIGGGTRVPEWVQALADCTGLPVDCAAVPEGGALGAAFMARMAAGLETSTADAARWARTSRRVEPDPAWVDHCTRRFSRFLELS